MLVLLLDTCEKESELMLGNEERDDGWKKQRNHDTLVGG